jgi:hypothetical protein
MAILLIPATQVAKIRDVSHHAWLEFVILIYYLKDLRNSY